MLTILSPTVYCYDIERSALTSFKTLIQVDCYATHYYYKLCIGSDL